MDLLRLRQKVSLLDNRLPLLESMINMFCNLNDEVLPRTNSATQTESCDAIMNLEAKLN